MDVAYIRVSSVEQNEARQLEALKPYRCEKIFIDKASGKNTDRAEFIKMMDFVRSGDVVFIEDFSRLSRSVTDLLSTLEKLNNKGVRLVSLKENFDTTTPVGGLMLTLIAAINEFERANLLERQREGIEIAKQEGKYRGRQPKIYDAETLNRVLDSIKNGSESVSWGARTLSISRQTMYNIMKKNGIQKDKTHSENNEIV